jgi:hypothetical protein
MPGKTNAKVISTSKELLSFVNSTKNYLDSNHIVFHVEGNEIKRTYPLTIPLLSKHNTTPTNEGI